MTTTSSVQVATSDVSSPSAITTSHDDSSRLAEAVAALNVRGASPPAKLPSAKTASSVVGSGGVDSGYASQTSTPDSSKGAFIVGGAPLSGNRMWPLPPRKTVKLKPFDKSIPKLSQIRFQDLRELYADDLNKLTRGLPRCQGILMSLTVLGESESTAKPWVFVQCDKALARKVRNFFKQPAVKSEFQPPQPDSYSPHFEIYICELPPKLLVRDDESSLLPPNGVVATDSIEIYSSGFDAEFSGTLCGTEVRAFTHGKIRTATIGGIIEVMKKDGELTMFGITAGHFLAQEQYEEDEEDQDEMSGDLDDDFSDEEDAFEFDISSLETESVITSDPNFGEVETIDESRQIPGSSVKIGHIYIASHDDLQDRPNLDWALFAIENQSFCLPNLIMKRDVTQISFTIAISSKRKVVLATAISRPMSGMLSESWSYVMLAPGKSLVRSYLLTLSDNKGKNLFLKDHYNAN
jgi:hypothetical protein